MTSASSSTRRRARRASSCAGIRRSRSAPTTPVRLRWGVADPVSADMKLAPNVGSDRSWVWNATADVSDGAPSADLLAIRFANSENANLFKKAFEEAQESNKALEAKDESDDEEEAKDE